MRRKTILIVCLFAVLFAAGVALATVGKFSKITSSATFSTSTTAAAAALATSTPTCPNPPPPSGLVAILTVNFTESGLGNIGASDCVTATATTITTTYLCVNGGSNQPKAANKITVTNPPTEGSGLFPVDHNGRITGQVTLSSTPAPPGTFACPPGQTESVFMTFANITLHDDTTGGSTLPGAVPDATTNTVPVG